MKKFTKVSLIIVAVMAGTGMILCGIASLMGAGYGTLRQMARNGEFNVGRWYIDDSNVYDDDWYDDDWYDGKNGSTANNVTEPGTESGLKASQTMQFSVGQVKNMDFDIDAANLVFEENMDDDNIRVELNRGKLSYYTCLLDGDTLKVKYNGNHHNQLKDYVRGTTRITVSIPKEMRFETLNLNIGAADADFEMLDITCNQLFIDVGAGSVSADSFVVDGQMEITIGAGDVDIEDGTYQDVKLDVGVGEMSLGGKVNGNITGHSGMGSLDLELRGNETDYNYDLSCGLGELEVNGTSYSSISGSRKVSNQGAIGTIRLDCGMGNIDLEIY